MLLLIKYLIQMLVYLIIVSKGHTKVSSNIKSSLIITLQIMYAKIQIV